MDDKMDQEQEQAFISDLLDADTFVDQQNEEEICPLKDSLKKRADQLSGKLDRREITPAQYEQRC